MQRLNSEEIVIWSGTIGRELFSSSARSMPPSHQDIRGALHTLKNCKALGDICVKMLISKNEECHLFSSMLSRAMWRYRRTCKRESCLLVGCLMSQQHASVSQGRICSDNCRFCLAEIEVEDQTFCLTQSQKTDTRLTSQHWPCNARHLAG